MNQKPDAMNRTYDMRPTPKHIKANYQPLCYAEELPPKAHIQKIVQHLLNSYIGQDFDIAHWRIKKKKFRVNWQENVQREGIGELVSRSSTELTFDGLCAYLRTNRSLDSQKLSLPPLTRNWMDSSVVLAMRFHAPCNEDSSHMTTVLPPAFAKNLPIQPQIDREGVAFSNIQLHLQKTLLSIRAKLVSESGLLFDFSDGAWLQNLTVYLNTAISLLEVTLNLIYYKAKYSSAEMGWKFDPEKLGHTHQRRLTDKLAWIGRITGYPLDNAQKELLSFKRLKEVRNHLHHFDPPVFAYTIEDAAEWLNQMADVATLLWKIRGKAGVPLSEPLIQMLLAPKVKFIPRDAGRRRVPQSAEMGYASCRAPRLLDD